MTIAKNPLVKLREANRATCYNGYINDMAGKTLDEFVRSCLRYDIKEGTAESTPARKSRIRRLARAAWDWWFQV